MYPLLYLCTWREWFAFFSLTFFFLVASTNPVCRIYRKWIRRVFKNLKIFAMLFSAMLEMEVLPKLDQCLNQYA